PTLLHTLLAGVHRAFLETRHTGHSLRHGTGVLQSSCGNSGSSTTVLLPAPAGGSITATLCPSACVVRLYMPGVEGYTWGAPNEVSMLPSPYAPTRATRRRGQRCCVPTCAAADVPAAARRNHRRPRRAGCRPLLPRAWAQSWS